MTFRLSRRSYSNLESVHEDLLRCVERAITITRVDFAVIEGMRSEARQRELVDKGASQTMDSRHLTGGAVDLAAWVDGTIRWDLGLYYPIAEAMRDAAAGLGVRLVWGGCWQLLSPMMRPAAEVAWYAASCSRAGRPAFIDAGHFERVA